MKSDIVLCGVGGQGILSIAAAIGWASLEEKLQLKQSEVHGMSQRGGAVQSHLRLSDKHIQSDLIPEGEADLILSAEPMEALRYLPYLNKEGMVIASENTFENINDYPPKSDILQAFGNISKKLTLDAETLAREAGSVKASNMVMLGAASPFIPISKENLIKGIKKLFGEKGQEIIDLNIKAFEAGAMASDKHPA
ncbi:MAG: indolepyruvate oxidoreductase subunit beta [Bacteroidota bacterium]